METVSLDLKGGALDLDTDALESIRGAVLAFLHDPDDSFTSEYGEMRGRFLQELEPALFVIDEISGTARIGGWILQPTLDKTGITLVRQAPRSPVMYLFHANIGQSTDGDWTVTRFGHTRVSR